jgi:hypothetical protein
MTFWCDGRSYESSSLRQFLTNDPSTPLILMTPDNRRVFVMRCEGLRGCRIDQANTLEIISLASRHNIRQLLNAYPAARVGEVQMMEMAAN